MEFIETGIQGLWVVQPRVYKDDRGYFFESFKKSAFLDKGIEIDFPQDNQSFSCKNVLRGLHFQKPPYAQGKLVRVVRGAVLDVAVDIRADSSTYGKYFSIELTEDNFTMLWIPEGFAHGFLTLKDDTIFSYKCTQYYEKSAEQAILWNDPILNIDWKIKDPVLSEKDKAGEKFSTFISPF